MCSSWSGLCVGRDPGTWLQWNRRSIREATKWRVCVRACWCLVPFRSDGRLSCARWGGEGGGSRVGPTGLGLCATARLHTLAMPAVELRSYPGAGTGAESWNSGLSKPHMHKGSVGVPDSVGQLAAKTSGDDEVWRSAAHNAFVADLGGIVDPKRTTWYRPRIIRREAPRARSHTVFRRGLVPLPTPVASVLPEDLVPPPASLCLKRTGERLCAPGERLRSTVGEHVMGWTGTSDRLRLLCL